MIPVFCITGPTATGKSDLGVAIAKIVHGEVISADSMQVYRNMDIGTAKLTADEMQGIPHHLLNVVNPDDSFTVADWKGLADAAIADIYARGRLPIVVGGTPLYIRALLDDLDFAETPGDLKVRERWQAYAQMHGAEALHEVLRDKDPITAQRLHPNDIRRVVRALEVWETRGQPLSTTYEWQPKPSRYDLALYVLTMDREALYRRVEVRVDRMVEQGLMEEVKRLLGAGYSPDLTSMQAIGYKEIASSLLGQMEPAEAIQQVKMATRRFVKRQLSWFRRESRAKWIERDEDGKLDVAKEKELFQTALQMAAGIPAHDRE